MKSPAATDEAPFVNRVIRFARIGVTTLNVQVAGAGLWDSARGQEEPIDGTWPVSDRSGNRVPAACTQLSKVDPALPLELGHQRMDNLGHKGLADEPINSQVVGLVVEVANVRFGFGRENHRIRVPGNGIRA
jgi:hypothetical protein